MSYMLHLLTHFTPMFHFYTPWKCQKARGFLKFSGSIKMEHGHKTCRFNQLHEEKNVLLTSKGKQITLGCYEIESYIKDRYCWSINTISNKIILFALLVCTYVTCLIFTCRRSDFFIISTKICPKKIGSWHIFCL